MTLPGCSPRGMFNKKDKFTAFSVGFLTLSVKVTPGTKDKSVFLARRVPYANKSISTPKNLSSLTLSLDTGKEPEYDKRLTPGYPGGGCVRSKAAFVPFEELTRTPSTALSNAPGPSLTEPPGDWFSRVHSWNDPSALSSSDPRNENRKYQHKSPLINNQYRHDS